MSKKYIIIFLSFILIFISNTSINTFAADDVAYENIFEESNGNGSSLSTILRYRADYNSNYTVTVPESLTLGTTASNATAATVTIQGATEIVRVVSTPASVT